MSVSLLPHLILIFSWILGLGIALAEDGKPRKGNISFFGYLTRLAILAGLLYWGGFFNSLLARFSN